MGVHPNKHRRSPKAVHIGGPGGALPPPAWPAPWFPPHRRPRVAAGGTKGCKFHVAIPLAIKIFFAYN